MRSIKRPSGGIASPVTAVLSAAAALVVLKAQPCSSASGAKNCPAPKFSPKAAVMARKPTAATRGPRNSTFFLAIAGCTRPEP